MFEHVLAVVQKQTEYEWRECFDAFAGSQEQPLISFWRLSDAAGILSQSRDLGGLSGRQTRSDHEQFVSTRQRRSAGGENSDDRKNEIDAALRKLNARRALDTRPRVVETWNVHGFCVRKSEY